MILFTDWPRPSQRFNSSDQRWQFACRETEVIIVVVGGMLVTLLFLNLIPLLYSLYGKRQPPTVVGMEH